MKNADKLGAEPTVKARRKPSQEADQTDPNSFHQKKKQARTTLNYIHSWSNKQAQVRARQLYMVTEGCLRQKKIANQLKLEAKLQKKNK